MTPAENQRFTQFLLHAADRTRQLGYPPNLFVKMINTEGGFATAKRLLIKPTYSDGFTELAMLRRLDLTVEALVLESEWCRFFDEEYLDAARKKLQKAEYRWAPWKPADEAVPRAEETLFVPPTSSGGNSAPVNALAEQTTSNDEGLAAALRKVLTGYSIAVREEFRGHPLAAFIRNELADLVFRSAGPAAYLQKKGSAGQGVWARGPWVALFNPIVTRSAQGGYFACFLFREDMKGVYLSLNQGMTEVKQSYKADAKTALHARAANFRALLGAQKIFPLLAIDLAPSSPSNDTAFYEAGNIVAKFYHSESLPSNHQLQADIQALLDLYDALILAENTLAALSDPDAPGTDEGLCEDPSRFHMHKRIERNAKLTEQVKKRKGCTCEACGMNFAERYGQLGAGYIEAHHLKPIATLDKVRVALDPEKDFAVLCANCHRMIHRSVHIGDIAQFKANHLSMQPFKFTQQPDT
jgi:5-methylcytosine-specific restriction enzyme A